MNLHAKYSMDAAVSEFGNAPEMWCDGQFAVLSDVVLGFFTLAQSAEGSHMRDPSTVIWKPSRIDYAPSDEYPWFPAAVRKVFDRSSGKAVRLRRHHIFIRPFGGSDFIYAGEAHLGSFASPLGDTPGNREACFSLSLKLPRAVWLECGGYTGWQVDVNHESHVVVENDDAAFNNLLHELLKRDYSHLRMTRYEEDSLSIYTNPRRSWMMYLCVPDDSGLYLVDATVSGGEEHFQCACGIPLDFPSRHTVSHSEAARIARYLFENGTLPVDVEWTKVRGQA